MQADELGVKRVGKPVWMAMAWAMPSRLWSGGVISPHRVVRGTSEAITAMLTKTGGGTSINTAYIERLNATFRSALAP
jgi:hypothetical protein